MLRSTRRFNPASTRPGPGSRPRRCRLREPADRRRPGNRRVELADKAITYRARLAVRYHPDVRHHGHRRVVNSTSSSRDRNRSAAGAHERRVDRDAERKQDRPTSAGLAGVLEGAERASTIALYTQAGFVAASLTFGLVAGDGRFDPGDDPSLSFLLRAWTVPSVHDALVFVGIGIGNGVGGYLMSQAYRVTRPSAIAPFEYVALPMSVMWGGPVLRPLAGRDRLRRNDADLRQRPLRAPPRSGRRAVSPQGVPDGRPRAEVAHAVLSPSRAEPRRKLSAESGREAPGRAGPSPLASESAASRAPCRAFAHRFAG